MMQMDGSRLEEAKRAKVIAVDKYKAGDLAGAKEFALKAKNLYPALSGLLCLIAIIDVLIGFGKRMNCEVDWYAVLAVDPTAELATIQRRYSNLYHAMILDSDNSGVSSDEAKKILGNAWKHFCNEKEKQLYDKKRQSHLGLQNLGRIPNVSHDNKSSSSNDSKPLEAIEDPAPSMTRDNPCSSDKQQKPQLRRAGQFPSLSFNSVDFSVLKRQRLFDLPKISSEESEQKAKVKGSGLVQPPLRISGHVNQSRRISGGESKRKEPPSTNLLHLNQFRRIGKDAGIRYLERRHDKFVLSPNMLQSAMVEKAKSVIKLSLERYVSASQHNNVGPAAATVTPQDSKICNAAKRPKCERKNTTNDMVKKEEPDLEVMNVPDPDFYNFDKDRTEASFGENQVWATYDDTDGMPRFYALVHSVVSQEPFKLRISWLNSQNNEELGPMNWIESGFYKTSGRFSIGRRSNNESLNSFSHRVQWTKGSKGFVHIYPKKGDVWALYTNWSPSWDYNTPKEVVNKYEMVEVLKDFDEEGCVKVAPLVKVPGFKTVFCRHPNQWTISKKELLRFSHQVTFHLLTGEDGENAPEGCLELDPAAMSLELLKVFNEDDMKRLDVVVKNPNEKVDDVVEIMNNVAIDDEANKESGNGK